jgi:hypothetical protein
MPTRAQRAAAQRAEYDRLRAIYERPRRKAAPEPEPEEEDDGDVMIFRGKQAGSFLDRFFGGGAQENSAGAGDELDDDEEDDDEEDDDEPDPPSNARGHGFFRDKGGRG